MRTHVIAEVGINHNGSVNIARQLIAAAADAGADSVKFQKRTPEQCVPRAEWVKPKETPWGTMPYIEYKRRMEFDVPTYVALFKYARSLDLQPFFSVWDQAALSDALAVQDKLGQWRLPWLKLPSAKLTDHALLRTTTSVAHALNIKLLLSTGMSTSDDVLGAYKVATQALAADAITLLHCHSAYPAPTDELNLQTLTWLRRCFPRSPVGYSGHEFGLEPTVWAVVLGATVVERHITLDHDMWGTDQRASVPPDAFKRMVQHIRAAEQALGSPNKRLWDSELPARTKLRGSAEVVA